MSSFSRLIITDNGKELLNASLTTGKKIVFTNAVTSDEKHLMDDLKELSDLHTIQQVPLKNVSVEENHIKMTIEFDNADLTDGYLLQALGIYAKLEDDFTEILFAVSKEETENTYIPPKNVTASGLNIKLTIYLENAENVMVNIDPAGVATLEDVHLVESKLNVHVNDAQKHISPVERNAWNSTYEQGTAYTDQKVADLINGAPETLDTIKEVADAIQRNETVVDALNDAIGKKASQAEFDTHVDNGVIHVTATERTNWNDKVTQQDFNNFVTKVNNAISPSWTYPKLKDTSKYTFLGNPMAIKVCGVGFLVANVRLNTAYTNGNPVLNIPEGFRGSINNIPCVVTSAVSGVTGATAATNGDIRFTTDMPANSWIQLNLVYLVTG